MVIAGRADDTVFGVKERVGTLDDVTTAVVLLRGEIAERLRLFGVQIADGDAAEQRHDRMTVAVKVDGRGGVCVRRLVGDIDLWIDAQRQNFIRGVGVVPVVVNIRVALCHVGVFLHLFGLQSLHGQCTG